MAKQDVYRNRIILKSAIRIIFGFVWLIDAWFKFQPGLPGAFVQMVQQVSQGQPAWMMPWFNFWISVVSQNPALWVYLTGIGELCLAIGLIFGLLRKPTYIVGIFLSLVIWAIPEGFGGAYGPGSTDIGTGVIYAITFICLIVINNSFGTSRYSLDGFIEKRVKWWRRVAEFQ